jgi:hypothetical protein
MGQRLNIQIEMDIPDSSESKVLANAYYHWSGYTSSAYELVNTIVQSGVYSLDILDPVEKAIKLLETTGAGLTKDEFTETYPESKYKLSENRSDGLIAISEEGMLETQNWEEARVTINLSTNMIDMGEVYYLDEVDEEDEDEDVANIPELEYDLHTSIYEFVDVYDEFQEKVESKNNYKVIDTHKQVLGVIG